MQALAGRLLNGMPWLINSGPIGAEIAHDRIFQRVGTSKAVPVSGVVAGGSGSVQVRVVNAADMSVVVAWQPVPVVGGVWSGVITTPQGGPYRWQAQDPSTGNVWTSGNSFYVGVLIALLGRSNMQYTVQWNGSINGQNYPLPPGEAWATSGGGPGIADSGHVARYRRYDGNGWWPLHAGDNGAPGPSFEAIGGGRGDALRLMATALQATMVGIPVGFLEYAIGGTGILAWATDGSGSAWNAFVAATTSAYGYYGVNGSDCGPDHEMALWLHGEDENASTQAVYAAGLTALWTGLKTLTGRVSGYRFGVVLVGPDQNAGVNMGMIRGIQLAFIAANAGAGVFFAGSFVDASLGGDVVHPVYTDRIRLGRRLANAIAHQLAPSAAPHGSAGPSISGATVNRSTGVIQVSVLHDAGSAVMTADGGTSGAAIGGFRAFVNGTQATISATAFSGGGIALTIPAAGLTGATVTIDHQAADAPYGANTAASSVVCDNAVVPTAPPYATFFGGVAAAVDPAWTDSRGYPLQPTAAPLVAA